MIHRRRINRHDTYWARFAPPTPGASARRALATLGVKARARRALLSVPDSATASVPRRLFGDRGPVAERQHHVRRVPLTHGKTARQRDATPSGRRGPSPRRRRAAAPGPVSHFASPVGDTRFPVPGAAAVRWP